MVEMGGIIIDRLALIEGAKRDVYTPTHTNTHIHIHTHTHTSYECSYTLGRDGSAGRIPDPTESRGANPGTGQERGDSR